jgi:hypothetical protein
MTTYVSLNSSGYVLLETQAPDVPSWAGDDRLVAEFIENKIDMNVAGSLHIRSWREGDEKRTRSRLHFREETQSWHTSLKCSMGSILPFGKTIIPDADVRLNKDEDRLELSIPRIITPIIKKSRTRGEKGILPTESPLWETSPLVDRVSRDYGIGSDHIPGLSKLLEEAGEVIQVGGKVMGVGTLGVHWDGSELDLRLEEEIGDLFAAAEFFTSHNHLNRQAIRKRAADKLAIFEKWHRNIQEGRDPNDDG